MCSIDTHKVIFPQEQINLRASEALLNYITQITKSSIKITYTINLKGIWSIISSLPITSIVA